MRERLVTLPELALIAGTRGMLGIGIGLLLANRLSSEQRRATGVALAVAGALSTIPLALIVLRQRRTNHRSERDRAQSHAAMMAD